jgi:cellulose synthase/poly-beta-1,6-N-acetylglucosamine synthase-like glycosyltransferase
MKQYAIRTCEINGRTYRRGDIVHYHREHPSLSVTPPNAGVTVKKRRARIVREGAIVSVIITFHNQKHYAADNLNGWYAQTFRFPIQIIAVDDSSEDGIEAFLAEHYPDVIYVRVDARNSAVARNAGKRLATGKYICHFDGDDYPYPAYLEKLHDALEANPDANLAYSRFTYEGYGLHTFQIPTCNHFEWTTSWPCYSPIINTPNMMRRELAERVRWDEAMVTTEDHEMNLQLIKAGAVGVQVRDVYPSKVRMPAGRQKTGHHVRHDDRPADGIGRLFEKHRRDRHAAPAHALAHVHRRGR